MRGCASARQHRDDPVRALRDGPGRLHVDADAGRRGARGRPREDQGRDRAGRRAVHQRDARRPDHRRLDLGARRLGQAAHRRRAGAQHARRGRGQQVERRCVRAARAQNGMVIGPGGQKATYGELAEAASKLTPPKDVKLKDHEGVPLRRQAA